MAVIEYFIGRNPQGRAVVERAIVQLTPGDQIRFITDRPGTALRCAADSPFASPSPGETYLVPMKGIQQQALVVAKPVAATIKWECGEVDAGGAFTGWPGDGPIFPDTGPH
jgi:hypothetical protein